MQNKYEILEIVGEGAFGIVMKCRNKESGDLVAIKKFKDSEDEVVQKSMLRELKVLKKLKHDNIVTFRDCFRRKGKLYLVFEYVERNLLQVIEENPNGLECNFIKKIMYQLCKAVIYIHSIETLHRDIKPENILITDEGNVKLCDFGFARGFPQKGGVLTDYVATRWYRAPELLLGTTVYGKEVDIWAIGCIMGELSDCQPMFPGETELNVLQLIQKLLGNFSQSQIEMFYSNPRYSLQKLENIVKPETLERRYLVKLNKSAISFMKALLKLDPRERLGSQDILMHSYFDDLRAEDPEFSHLKKENSNHNKLPIKNINSRTNKFQATKRDFYPSKSPPTHDPINNPNSSFLNFNNSNTLNTQNVHTKFKDTQHKVNKKQIQSNNEQNNNMTSTFTANFYKGGYKSIYNETKEDIYNFEIGNLPYDENGLKKEEPKKKKNIPSLNIIEEEVENIKKNYDLRINRFKPDTGADFYEEDVYREKNYPSPKNIIIPNTKRKIVKEESPDNKNIISFNSNNINHYPNFLPQISTNRGFGDFGKKEKNK